VVCACLIAASGGALYGYDKGIAGGVSGMNSFLLKFYPEVYAANQASAKTVDPYGQDASASQNDL